MKALARKRGKVGRPKKLDTAREPNGRPQRVDGETCLTNLEMEVATWKRRQRVDAFGRVFTDPNLTPLEARMPEHGSVIAAWLERWKRMNTHSPDGAHPIMFTQLHYDSALRYHELHARWLVAIGATNMRSSSEFGGVKSHPGDPFMEHAAKRDAKTIADFRTARRAVLECGSPLGMMALETIVIENQPADGMMGDLRMALNKLATLWRLQAAA